MGRCVVDIMYMKRCLLRGCGGARAGCRAGAYGKDPSIAWTPWAVLFSVCVAGRVGVGRRRLATCAKDLLSRSSSAQSWIIICFGWYARRGGRPGRKRHGAIVARALLLRDVIVVGSAKARVGAAMLVHWPRATWWRLERGCRCFHFCAKQRLSLRTRILLRGVLGRRS